MSNYRSLKDIVYDYGYIEHIPRRGFFTRELTLDRVRHIYEIIGNLVIKISSELSST